MRTAVPIRFQTLQTAQQKDYSLLMKVARDEICRLRSFHGGGIKSPRQLICLYGKIVVPAPLQQHMVNRHHDFLCHPGTDRTEDTVSQHFI